MDLKKIHEKLLDKITGGQGKDFSSEYRFPANNKEVDALLEHAMEMEPSGKVFVKGLPLHVKILEDAKNMTDYALFNMSRFDVYSEGDRKEVESTGEKKLAVAEYSLEKMKSLGIDIHINFDDGKTPTKVKQYIEDNPPIASLTSPAVNTEISM